MKRLVFVASSLLLLAVFACDDRVTGGNGTSTDNVVTARLLPVDSLADSLPDGDLGPYPLLVRLDSGNIDFSHSWRDGSDFRVQRPDSSALAFQIREWDSASGHASIWVRLDRFHRGSGQSIRIVQGKDSVTSRSNALATWWGVSSYVRQRVASVLLDDFDSASSIGLLPCKCDTWYLAKSSGGKLISPSWGMPFTSAIQPAGSGRAGGALHVSFTAKSPDYVLAGIRFGKGFRRMGGLDSITFWSRGSGTLHIALENVTDTSGYKKAWAGVTMTTAWTHYSIKPSDFEAKTPRTSGAGGIQGTIGWDGVKDSVTSFSVFGQDGTDFWIDSVVFHGMSPSEFR